MPFQYKYNIGNTRGIVQWHFVFKFIAHNCTLNLDLDGKN